MSCERVEWEHIVTVLVEKKRTERYLAHGKKISYTHCMATMGHTLRTALDKKVVIKKRNDMYTYLVAEQCVRIHNTLFLQLLTLLPSDRFNRIQS